MGQIPVNWSPYATNPLDFVVGHRRANEKLVSRNGRPVTISQSGMDFVVTIGGHRKNAGGNVNTCYYLNRNEVGIVAQKALGPYRGVRMPNVEAEMRRWMQRMMLVGMPGQRMINTAARKWGVSYNVAQRVHRKLLVRTPGSKSVEALIDVITGELTRQLSTGGAARSLKGRAPREMYDLAMRIPNHVIGRLAGTDYADDADVIGGAFADFVRARPNKYQHLAVAWRDFEKAAKRNPGLIENVEVDWVSNYRRPLEQIERRG